MSTGPICVVTGCDEEAKYRLPGGEFCTHHAVQYALDNDWPPMREAKAAHDALTAEPIDSTPKGT